MNIDYSVIPEITISYRDKVKASERAIVRCSHSAREIFRKKFENFMQHHEEFWVMYLNRSHRVLGVYQTSKCGISNTMVDNRIILQAALKSNATAMIVCHYVK